MRTERFVVQWQRPQDRQWFDAMSCATNAAAIAEKKHLKKAEPATRFRIVSRTLEESVVEEDV
jgi:hypothetical protein